MKENFSIKQELTYLKMKSNFCKKIYCTDRENSAYSKTLKEGGALPGGVYREEPMNGDWGCFYTVGESGLTQEEKYEYFVMKQLESFRNISTIKACVIFFAVLAIISLSCAFLAIILRMQ